MSRGYVKLFSEILDSTVWELSLPAKVLWITLLAMCDRDGEVSASVPGLAKRAGIGRIDCERALELFLAPDPDSRTRAHDGRRIEVIEGGWRVLNYEFYRDRASVDEKREKDAARQRRKYAREKSKTSRDLTQPHAPLTGAHDTSPILAPQIHLPSASASADASATDQSARSARTARAHTDRDPDPEQPPDCLAAELELEHPGIDGGSIAEAVSQALRAASGHAWGSESWLQALSWIAVQPIAEYRSVMSALAALRASGDKFLASGSCTPAHVKKMWSKYSLGPQVSPDVARARAEERADQIRRARVDLDHARMGMTQTDGREHDHYDTLAKRAEDRLRSLGAQP